MKAVLKEPPRIPFDSDFFFLAMIGLLEREPDKCTRQGHDGFYSYIYAPRSDQEREVFKKNLSWLRAMLDSYDIIFSGSHCVYAEQDPDHGECLWVQIKHPVTKETSAEADALDCNM